MRLLHCCFSSFFCRTQKGYPLLIQATKVEYIATPVNYEFIQKILPKLDYPVFYQAAQQMAAALCQPPLPTLPTSLDKVTLQLSSQEEEPIKDMLQRIHTVLLDYHIMEGVMVCPDTGRKFTILQGIPNMVLHEDEL